MTDVGVRGNVRADRAARGEGGGESLSEGCLRTSPADYGQEAGIFTVPWPKHFEIKIKFVWVCISIP
jgi:hypothetical protein